MNISAFLPQHSDFLASQILGELAIGKAYLEERGCHASDYYSEKSALIKGLKAEQPTRWKTVKKSIERFVAFSEIGGEGWSLFDHIDSIFSWDESAIRWFMNPRMLAKWLVMAGEDLKAILEQDAPGLELKELKFLAKAAGVIGEAEPKEEKIPISVAQRMAEEAASNAAIRERQVLQEEGWVSPDVYQEVLKLQQEPTLVTVATNTPEKEPRPGDVVRVVKAPNPDVEGQLVLFDRLGKETNALGDEYEVAILKMEVGSSYEREVSLYKWQENVRTTDISLPELKRIVAARYAVLEAQSLKEEIKMSNPARVSQELANSLRMTLGETLADRLAAAGEGGIRGIANFFRNLITQGEMAYA